MTSPPPAAGSTPLAQAPVIAHVVRGELVESVHHGLGVLTSASGEVEVAVGDVRAAMFPRSSNKPMQAVGMLRSRLDLDGELLIRGSRGGHAVQPRRRRLGAGGGRADRSV